MDYGELSKGIMGIARPETDEYFLLMAQLVSTRSTCIRRRVGCILTNSFNHIIATGYNGVAAGTPHCINSPCAGANQPSGQGLHLCEAIHAEQNAIIQCRDITSISTAYVSSSPCIFCIRLLLGTSCKRIVFSEEYPHPAARELWIKANRHWIRKPLY